jgi:SAM-dependent methyltransferase
MENTITRNVNYAPLPETGNPDRHFERSYIRLRQKEKWLYSDEEVSTLPAVTRDDPHYMEWVLRQESCKRLVNYLRSKPGKIQILEIGCGNGWLSNQMAAVYGTHVTGLDVNLTELEQAARVFNRFSNLQFVQGNIFSETLADKRFDLIVFAASIQYFSSLPAIIGTTQKLLNEGGEIHILDSHLYKASGLPQARQRSEQ